jgi:thiamine-phosphate pyrophosphorylase
LDLLDYVCIGGVFATSSKDNPNPPQGVAGVRAFADIIRARAPAGFPVGAIAGITAANAGDVIAGGLDGVAVITALSNDHDPAAAARRLRGIVDGALKVTA